MKTHLILIASCSASLGVWSLPSALAFLGANPSITRSQCYHVTGSIPSAAAAPTILSGVATDGNKGQPFEIREADYSDLTQAADLMTDGFYPGLRDNPILRPLRYLIELDRLQRNFPYDDIDRHYYLVAYYTGEEAIGRVIEKERKVIGFCDVDGRIPDIAESTARHRFALSSLPFAKRVVRPQPYFSDLSVDPDHRRRGVASALMVEAERRAREMGFDELYLGVRSTNELALQMYGRMGYESVDTLSGDMVDFLAIQKEVSLLRRSLLELPATEYIV